VRLDLKDLKIFANCPLAFCFSRKAEKLGRTELEKIVTDIVCKSVMHATETSFCADWRTIVGWVDKEVFKSSDIYEEEHFQAAKKQSEHALLALAIWYEQIYLQWTSEAFTNVPLGVEKSGIFIQGTAPIIHLKNPILCTYIGSNLFKNKKELFNDIEIRGLAWLISDHLKCDEVNLQALCLGKRGGLEITNLTYDSSSLNRTRQYLDNMCRIIKKKYYYPSIGASCYTCDYYNKCNP